MKISRYLFMVCLVFSLISCDEIARKIGYVSADSVSVPSVETDAQKVQKEKEKIKENIANYVKIIWYFDSYCIENNTDYTLEKVSVMTAWTQYVDGEKIGFQEPRQFTYIPAHSKSSSIEYDHFRMKDMKGQIYEIKCSALGLH